MEAALFHRTAKCKGVLPDESWALARVGHLSRSVARLRCLYD